MDKQTALNIIAFLDRVQVQWIKENAEYNRCISVLTDYANKEDEEQTTSKEKKK